MSQYKIFSFVKTLIARSLRLEFYKKKKKGFYQRKFLALNSHPFFVCVKYLRWRVQPWGVSCIQLWEVPVSEEKKAKIRLWTQLVLYRLFFLRSIAQFFMQIYMNFFRQFISWTMRVNSGKLTDNCWISCQVMADMKKKFTTIS